MGIVYDSRDGKYLPTGTLTLIAVDQEDARFGATRYMQAGATGITMPRDEWIALGKPIQVKAHVWAVEPTDASG